MVVQTAGLGIPVSFARCDQLRPIIGRIAGPQHFPKNGVGVRLATRRAQGVFIIDPGKDDDPRLGIKTKEQPKATTDFGATPVSEGAAHSVALPIFFTVGIARNCFQHEV